MTKKFYDDAQVLTLAILAAEDYAAECNGPTIRGKNGEKNLRGNSLEEVAKANGLSLAEAAALTLDLSTASFEELSPHWQQVNIDSARGMIDLMEQMGGEEAILGLDLEDPATIIKYGSLLHEKWLEQPSNSWAKGTELDLPFILLDPDQQRKDIQQLRSLQKWLHSIRG